MPLIMTSPYKATPFDLGGFTYDSIFATVGGNPSQLNFSDDGTSMYLNVDATDDTQQYSVGTPWDMSTVNSTPVASQNISINNQTLQFSPDGTKYYIRRSNSGHPIQQYTLSPAWDLSTSVYSGKSFVTPTGNGQTLAFNGDGTKMITGNGVPDTLYRHTLSTPYDISTASYDGSTAVPGGGSDDLFHFIFNDDGTKMFIVMAGPDEVRQYSLSTPYDVTTIAYDSIALYVGGETNFPSGVRFNPDYTKMFISSYSTTRVYQYSL